MQPSISTSGVPPTAAVTLKHADGRIVCEPAVGDGPVDAVLKSIQRGTGVELKVADYRVRSVTGGLDAQGEASVEVELDGRKISGRQRPVKITPGQIRQLPQLSYRGTGRRGATACSTDSRDSAS